MGEDPSGLDGLGAELVAATTGRTVPQLRKATGMFWRRHGGDGARVVAALAALWHSDAARADVAVRMAIAMTLGAASSRHTAAESFLQGPVAADDDWRVHEALAKGFDWACTERGWEASLPTVRAWLGHDDAPVRRAAAEGPRVWTKRPYFAERPELALDLLGSMRRETDSYARASVANALSDITKTHPDEAVTRLAEWAGDSGAGWVVKRACRHLVTARPQAAERILAVLNSDLLHTNRLDATGGHPTR